jgi:putative DNA primase/helicase
LGKEAEQTPLKINQAEGEGEEIQYVLELKEPSIFQKAVIAWSVLKESWAYHPKIGWYEWQGKHWGLRSEDEFVAALTCFMDAQNWTKRTSNEKRSVIDELRSRLLVKEENWNPEDKLAFSNGMLDLRSLIFQEGHNPQDRMTRSRPYPYQDLRGHQNWELICPNWMKFLRDATGGDRELQDLLQAWVRYAVLPRPKQHKSEIEKSLDLFGSKGTGKGTFLDVLIQLVGQENVGSASPEIFQTPQGLGQLIDKDLAIDTDASGFLQNIGNYNKVISNEPVVVKKLYRDTATIRLGVVVIRAYNAVLQVPDGSEGLDRRLTVIPFDHPPPILDLKLSQKLEAELSGIFDWALSIDAEEMKQRILSAGSIQKIAEASIERFEANNPEYRFLVETFPNGRSAIQAGDLYQSYCEWSRANSQHSKSWVKFAPAIQ